MDEGTHCRDFYDDRSSYHDGPSRFGIASLIFGSLELLIELPDFVIDSLEPSWKAMRYLPMN